MSLNKIAGSNVMTVLADTAVWYQDNIFRSEYLSSPFVLSIIKPRIYLPFKLNGQDLEHVVAHEQAHIRRKDHWWKPRLSHIISHSIQHLEV